MSLGYRVDVLFIRGYRSRFAYPAAAAIVAVANCRRRYALVHAHGGEAAVVARFYVRAPVLGSYCGDDLLGTPTAHGTIRRTSRLRRSLVRAHARFMSATITKSREMEDALPASSRSTNSVIPNGVDTSLFAPASRADARSALGWGNGGVVLFVGDPRITRKRFRLAEAAYLLARESVAALRLHVAAGVVPDRVPELMNAADCLVLTSSIEGSPNVVKEALMCNLPVVATDVGDVRDLLAGVEPSAVVEPTARAIADAIVWCVDPPRRSNGRAACQQLTADAVARRVVGVYERLGVPAPRVAAA